MAYYRCEDDDLAYAVKIAGEWQIELADWETTTGLSPSLVLTDQGEPLICHFDVWHGVLKLTSKV
ncbi:MAG: hypothetical protein JSW71_07965, partial [Gemmatimonadota bacterium]